MLDFWTQLLDTSDFPARWRCGRWNEGHGWLHILSDLGVWSAYLAIAVALFAFARRRKDIPFRNLFWLFSAFILLCGTTHLMEAVIFWWPAYRLAGVFKLATAIVSWATVLALIPILPRAFALRSPEELARVVVERRRAENELRASELRYKQLSAGVREYAIFLLDATGHIASWNAGAVRMKGYTTEEIVGRHFSCFYPPEDVAAGKTERELRIARETGRYEEEGWRVRQDGSRFWANVSISAIYDDDGRFQGFAKVTRDLTAKRAAEKALQRAEDRFRAIFDQTFQFVGLMAADGTLLEANRTALAALGIPEDQVLGLPFWDTPWWAHDATQQNRLRDAVGRAAAGETVRFEAHYPAPDGSTIWVDFSLKPFTSEGNVVYLIPEARDITQRKRTEEALRESEQRLRLAAEAAGVGVWEWDVLTNRIHWDDQMFRIYRVAPTPDGFVPYETWRGAVLEEDLARQEVSLRDTVQRLGSGTRAFRIRWPDGSCRFIEAAEQVRVNADGRAERVVGTNLDVSARRRAEETLRDSEERFRSAFESAPIGIALVGPDGKWLRVNRAVCELLGYTADELLAIDFQTVTHPDDLGADLDYLRQVLDGTIPVYQMEKRYFHKRGHVVPVLLSVSLVRDGAGAPHYFISQIVDISQRKRTEEALAANETLLHQFIKHSPAAIAMLDAEMRYLRTSDQWATDYHLTEQQVIGRSHYDVFPDAQERWKPIHRRVLDGAVESCAEDPFPRPDGSREWLQWEARPWREPGGKIGGVIFFTQVITARKRTEVALQESEARFRAVFEGSPSSLILVNRAGRIVLSNDLTLRMFGWAGGELMGETIERLVPDRFQVRHPTDRDPDFAAPNAPVTGGRGDRPGRRKDGSEFPVEVGLTPVESGGEQFVLASVVDISARKRTEEALRVSEERLRLALENARHALWDWNVRSGTVHYGGVWAEMHGYVTDEMIGDYAWWESSIHPDDKARVIRALNLHLASDDAIYDADYRARRKDGSWFWINTRGRAHSRDEAGRAVRVMGTMQDITERKRTESALVKSVLEKEVMLREIHHRVKNNLAVISSLFHLQASTIDDPKIARVLREAQDRVRSMALVHEHLYNSADLGAVAFGEYAKTLVAQIVETYRLPTTPVDLVLEIGAVALSIEQSIPCGLILNELLSNCLKHAFRDRARGKVIFAIAAAEGACEIRVADDGVGLPDGLDVRAGKSLGVRLVRILARQLVGSVEYRSPGTGTDVRLKFPIHNQRKN